MCQLEREHAGAVADERPDASQRLVDHHADRIPVGCFGQRLASGLLGCHVRHRADNVPLPGQRGPGRNRRFGLQRRRRHRHCVVVGEVQLFDEAEIEDGDATVGPDQHVGRFEIAVQDAVIVQVHHAFSELPHRVSQPLRISAALRVNPGGALSRAIPSCAFASISVRVFSSGDAGRGAQRT